jgi:hypothetical protein
VEYDAVQTAMYDAKNELADVKSSVRRKIRSFLTPSCSADRVFPFSQSALRISELEAANREQQSQLQDLQRDLEEYRRWACFWKGFYVEPLAFDLRLP